MIASVISSKGQRYFAALAVALLLLFAAPGLRVQGASITVNATCSLADAMIAANDDRATGGCRAGNGADTITLTGDITLTETLVNLDTSVTIEGNNYSISGNNARRIFDISKLLNLPRPTLTIRNLTLKNGKASKGGAIYAQFSDVVIENSKFTDNRATTEGGAVWAYVGQLTITGSTFSGNRAEDGGAIYSNVNSTISGSSFTNNTVSGWNQISGYGGAINNSGGTLTIRKSAFGNNRANYGGAVFGGLSSTIHVYNSTIYNNSAVAQNSAPSSSGFGGALYNQGRVTTVTNTTLNGNTAKNSGDTLQTLSTWSDVELYNNIITGANGDAGEHCDIANVTENENNFISDGTCDADLDSGDGSINLGALTGSPAYYPLQSGSVALDAGDSTHCASDDILGTSRPQGSGCDLGAYELPVSGTATATGMGMQQAVTPTATATAAPPPAPTDLTAQTSRDGIELSWTAPAEAVDGYQILRQRPENGETEPEQVALLLVSSASSFTDSTATSDDLYVYTVKSVRGSLYSEASDEARLDLRPTATPTETPTITPTATATETPTITPTATATVTPTPRPCTLAEEIEAANSDRAVGACSAGSGADTISLSRDYILTDALPNITSNITINGNGYSIRGNDSYTILNVSSGGNLTLNRVTVMDGSGTAVGGIMNYGTLTIKNSTIADNSGGVVGGVFNSGSLKVINSTMSGNSGGFVGGVLFSGGRNMELYNSLLAGNTNGDCFGGVNASAGNLIVSGSCGTAITDDPLLSALTGSPRYYPLQAGSPAMDAADSSHCLEVDQLGNSRPQGSGCDIGAIEYQTESVEDTATATESSTPTATDTPAATVTSTPTATATDTLTATATSTSTATATDTPTATANATLTATTTPVTPGSPTNLTAAIVENGVKLNWDAPTGPVDSYEILRSRDFLGETMQTYVADTGSAATTYTDTAATEATRYTYRVKAILYGVRGPESLFTFVDILPTATPIPPTDTPVPTSTATATLQALEQESAPTSTPIATLISRGVYGLSLSSNQPGELSLTWDRPAQSPHDYRVRWARVGESYKTWSDSAGNAFPSGESYTITGLDAGERYKVQVRGRYDDVPGPWSEEQQINIMASAPTDTPVPLTNTPVPTNTPAPLTNTPVPSNTPVPPTSTPIPTDTPVPADAKAVANVQLSSNQAGVLAVTWDAPSQTPRDYRIAWAKDDENFKNVQDTSGNAFPTSPSYTITGLDGGVRYKVKLRSRYSGESNGGWTDEYSTVVAS